MERLAMPDRWAAAFAVACLVFVGWNVSDLWLNGLPQLYYTDEWHVFNTVLRMLEMRSTNPAVTGFEVGSFMTYNGGYVHFLYYATRIVLAPVRLFGGFDDRSDFLFVNAAEFMFAWRALSLVFLGATLFVIWKTASLISERLAGVIALAHVCLSYAVLRVVSYGKAETFTLLLGAIGFYFLCRFLLQGRTRHFVMLWLVCALVAAAKLTALTFCLPTIAVATIALFVRNPWRIALKTSLGAAVAAVAAVCLFMPHFLPNLGAIMKYAMTIGGDGEAYMDKIGIPRFTDGNFLPLTRHWLRKFAMIFTTFHLMLVAMAVGMIGARWSRHRWLLAWLILTVVVNFAFFRRPFLDAVFSYYAIPVIAPVALVIWALLREGLALPGRVFKKLPTRVATQLVPHAALSILAAYSLWVFGRTNLKAYSNWPKGAETEEYASNFAALTRIDAEIPFGSKIAFGSTAARPNPYLYRATMVYDLFGAAIVDGQRTFDYLFSSMTSDLKLPDGVQAKRIPEAALFQRTLLKTGRMAAPEQTPYSVLAANWIALFEHAAGKSELQSWKEALPGSVLPNSQFSTWEGQLPASYAVLDRPEAAKVERGTAADVAADWEGSPVAFSGGSFNFGIILPPQATEQTWTLFSLVKSGSPGKYRNCSVREKDSVGGRSEFHPGDGKYHTLVSHVRVASDGRTHIRALCASSDDEGSAILAAVALVPAQVDLIAEAAAKASFTSGTPFQAGFFWASDGGWRPKTQFHWQIDWDAAQKTEVATLSAKYFTYVPLSRIPELATRSRVEIQVPRPLTAKARLVLKFENVSGFTIYSKTLRVDDDGKFPIFNAPLPFVALNKWGTNAANLKIEYHAAEPTTEMPHVRFF